MVNKRAIDRCVKKRSRPFPHPRPSACICGSKVRSPFPHPRPSVCICGSKERSTGASKRAIDLSPSASINVHLRFKSATGASKRDLALSPIRVHQRVSAVQKSDRPVRQKEISPFPPSASINVHLRFKSAIGLTIELSELSQVQFNQEPPNH
ncbi:hypothetical protein QUB52_08820 [Microcoleus sp. A6-C6]